MKKKFNVIDGLLLVLVVVVAIGGFFYLKKDDGQPSMIVGKQKVIIVAEGYKVEPDICDSIQIGDVATAAGEYLDAKITDLLIEDDLSVEAVNGELVAVQNPTKKHVVVTFEGMANRYGPYLDLGGQELKVGKTYYIKTDKMHIFGTLIEVKLIQE